MRWSETALAKLAESGLDVDDAKVLEISYRPAEHTVELAPHYSELPSLLIRYHGPEGMLYTDKFHRVRYLEQLSAFAQGRKYDQPADVMPRAYFPRIQTRWDKITGDTRVKITITEGELKAACATKMGIPTIGLGGVWSFRSKRFNCSFLPELDAVNWKSRPVELVFDSDIDGNADVQNALLALCEELQSRGANVVRVVLPTDAEGKVGLDDFLVAKGREAYEMLERIAVDLNAARNRQIIQQFAYIEDQDKFVRVADALICKNRTHFFNLTSGIPVDGPRGRKVPLSKVWLESPDRLNLPTMVFQPWEERRIIPNVGLNRFKGWGVEPTPGDVEPMRFVMRKLCNHRMALYKWLMQWMAFPIQNPGAKLSHAIFVFSNEHGVGKSAVGQAHMDVFHAAHRMTLKGQDIMGSWNEWLNSTCFALVDELDSDTTAAARSHIKEVISEARMACHERYEKTAQVDNRCNFYFTSNSPGSLPFEGGNRRICAINARSGAPKEYLEKEFDQWRRNNGAAHWMYYLQHEVDLEGFNPRSNPYKTPEEALCIQATSTTMEAWVRNALNTGALKESPLWRVGQLIRRYQREVAERRGSRRGMAQALFLNGCVQIPPLVLEDGGRVEDLWAVDDTKRWTRKKAEACFEAWEKYFPDLHARLPAGHLRTMVGDPDGL